MKKIILPVIVILVSLYSCSTTKKSSGNSNSSENSSQTKSSASAQQGLSFETAILIDEVHEGDGVAAEYKWLKKNYPGYQSEGQSLTWNNKKPYDIISILLPDGTKQKIYFDISKFFGKF